MAAFRALDNEGNIEEEQPPELGSPSTFILCSPGCVITQANLCVSNVVLKLIYKASSMNQLWLRSFFSYNCRYLFSVCLSLLHSKLHEGWDHVVSMLSHLQGLAQGLAHNSCSRVYVDQMMSEW